MTTITINERTKAGKIVLELAKILSVSNKGVAIEPKEVAKPASKAKEEGTYDPKFVAMIKKRIANEKFTPIHTKSIWESI
ncbi:hypothetical protein ACFX5D_01755 [Flavobacterium sp. LB3P45]|uniref:Uncharacterized protein n=1 Tax=Flavobacterium fructosi TaxID=3230416 RepID=A0ABW6HI37_9FLAO